MNDGPYFYKPTGMGTESEALRWKQWIDRWIKISSPESAQTSTATAASSNSSSKIDLNPPSGTRKSFLTPEQLRYQLINMVKEGDPIFCEGLCKELFQNVSHLRLAMKCLMGVETSEKARAFFCQVIFYLCKCPSPSVRKFLLSLLPALLFSHFILYSEETETTETAEEGQEGESNLNSIEIALLALYQSDMNYQPEPLSIRVPSLQSNSLYHSSMKSTENFPFNVNPSLIHAPLHLYPTFPIVKVTDYTRFVIYYRLCRAFQDFIPAMQDLSVVMYSFWIERCVAGGCVVENLEALESFFHKQITQTETDVSLNSLAASSSSHTLTPSHHSSSYQVQSTVSTRHLESEDWKFVKFLVLKAVKLRIRTPVHEELYLLWTDCIPIVMARYLVLGDILRNQILNRSRMELLPQIVMALE